MRIKAKEQPEIIPEEPYTCSMESFLPEDEPYTCPEETVQEPVTSESKQPKKRFETSKLIVWVCLINGFLWVWCSYILAWFGREQIAESLSQVALTEIIGVVLIHCAKTVVENLSKNNKWPDKPGEDESPGGLG